MGWLRHWRFLVGYVRFCAEGGFPADFLSEATAHGIRLSDTERKGERFYAYCPAKQYRLLRPIAKRACMRLRVVRKSGLYFRLFPYRRRAGLPVGLAMAAALLVLLTRFVWIVQPEGNVRLSDKRILETVAALGVYPGCRIDKVDMENLRMQALSGLPELVYLSVNPHGCVARVAVKEREGQPTIQDFSAPASNLVATREGRILSLRVYSGQAAVAVGDGVAAGTLLVSGAVESASGNVRLFRAAGEVTAETFHTLTVTVPATEQQLLPCGKAVYRPSLRFLKWELPLFGSGELQGTYAVAEYARQPQRNGITLPVGVIERAYTPLAETAVHFSPDAALVTAEERMAQKIGALAASGVTVVEQTARTADTENGCTLTVTLRCEENIAFERLMDITAANP